MPHTSTQWRIAFSMSRTTIPTWRIGPNNRLIGYPPCSPNPDCDAGIMAEQAGAAQLTQAARWPRWSRRIVDLRGSMLTRRHVVLSMLLVVFAPAAYGQLQTFP